MKAAERIHHYVDEKKMKVYVHDTTSATRGPSAAIVYLCLYMKHQEWKEVNRVQSFVKTHHPYSVSNMVIV